MKNIIFLFFLFFYNLNSLSGTEKNDIIFPFENNILKFNIHDGSIYPVKKTNLFFSNDYFKSDDKYYFITKNKKKLTVKKFTHNDFIDLLSDNCSKAYIADNYLLTVSKNSYSENKFKFIIYKIIEQNNKISLNPGKKNFLDLIITDYEIINNSIFISGTDVNNKNNIVYLINLEYGFNKLILKTSKNKDFLKFIHGIGKLFIYNSSVPAGNATKKIWTIVVEEKNLPDLNNNILVREKIINDDSYNFFGKGIFKKNNLLISVIDKRNNTYLAEFTENLDKKKSTKIYTGIYKILDNNDNKLFFIGYNFFKDKTKFYFIVYDLRLLKEIKIIPLERF